MSIDDRAAGTPVPLAVLDALELSGLDGVEVIDHARACFRARNQATARFLTALHEAGRAVDGQKGRPALLDEFSGDEAAAALGWSRAMASRWLDLADDLLRRLPEVHAAMRGGELDDTKARVISDWTRDLADDHAHHVCAVVLPEAPALPVAALIERIQQVATALDPQWAERRERTAEKQARVLSSRNPSGTANVCGYDLPMERTAVGMARLEALAAALRRRGVPVKIGTLRAHVYMALFDGTAVGLDDDALLDLLATELGPDDTDDNGPSDDGPDDDGPDDDGPDDDGPEDGPSDGPDDDEPGDDGSRNDSGPDAVPPPEKLDGGDDPSGRDTGLEPAGRSGVRDGTVEVRVRLTTALGLDDLPAQLPGWGTVIAPTARNLLERYRHGEWRVVLTDPDGRLEHLLLARRRPLAGPDTRPPGIGRPPVPRRHQRRGRTGPAIVELQVPTTLLAALHPNDHPGWASLLRELQARLPGLAATPRGPDDHVHPADARHRRPSAEIDRWVRARDGTCIAPACGRPAHSTDLDHTLDHGRGGPSLSRNLGALCRHHHRAKHDAGWRITQPEPGRFHITTRAGARYDTRPRRILEPLPTPRPAATPRPLPAHEQHHDDPDTDPAEHDDLVRSLEPRRPRARRAESPAPRTDAQRASLRRRRDEPLTPTPDPDPPPF